MQGLREAKALLDEGVLSQEEFNTEKAVLVKKRDERKKAAEGGVPPPPSSLPTGVQQHLSQVEQLIRPLKRNSADHDGVGGIAQDKKNSVLNKTPVELQELIRQQKQILTVRL